MKEAIFAAMMSVWLLPAAHAADAVVATSPAASATEAEEQLDAGLKRFGYLAVRQAFRQQVEHLALAVRPGDCILVCARARSHAASLPRNPPVPPYPIVKTTNC